MSDSPAARAWSSAQLIRLEGEWRGLLRAFAFHPFVEIIPLAGDPPYEYQVQYKATTLAIDAAGLLAYVPAMPMHLWLPPHFPHEAPVVRPMAAAFHPNVTMDWVQFSPAWRPNATLADLVTQVGQLLIFQSYDPDVVLNPVAMSWVYANLALLPTDAAADFSAGAGGEGPASRVARFGPAAIEEQRARVEAMCDRLASPTPPAEPEVRHFAWRVRLALALFDDPDAPDGLRRAAADVEEAVLSMRGPASVWSQVARQVATAEAAGAAAARVAAAESALRQALAEAEATGTKPDAAPPPPDAAEHGARGPLQDLPELSTVQPAALELRRVLRDAEEAAADLRLRLAQLAPPPRTAGLLPGGMLSRRLAREAARAAAAAEPARASGAALASFDPVLERARLESEALDRVAAWAEFSDLMRRGEDLARGLAGADPARFHAFYAADAGGAGGESGPFPYEKAVEAGGRVLAVSNPRGTSLRVFDAETEELIAAGDGAVTVPRRDSSGGTRGPGAAPASAVVLRPGERTDDLRVQLEYLLTQTADTLERLAPGGAAPADGADRQPDSWAGRLAAALTDEESIRPFVDAHRRASHRWKLLLAELAALGRFKRRLATCHLLSRLVQFAPRAAARAERAREAAARAETRLAEIAARSAGDVETERLIIPQHLAAEYADRVAERDHARQEMARMARSLQGAAERARARLAKAKLVGSADPPALRLVGPLSPRLVARGELSDASVDALVGRLEGLLGVKLRETAAAPAESGARPGGST